MSHPRTLIESILSKVQEDYPQPTHSVVVEKSIPGTRVMPDLQILRDGEIVCVVEIGYTRPEKLTLYTALGIPDVRWYDKEGVLHTPLERTTRVEKVVFNPDGQLYIYELDDCIDCQSDDCNAAFDEEGLTEEQIFEIYDHLSDDVHTTFVIFGDKCWLICFCDKCGEAFLSRDEYAYPVTEYRESRASEFSRQHGARRVLSWCQVQREMLDRYDIELDYSSSLPLYRER